MADDLFEENKNALVLPYNPKYLSQDFEEGMPLKDFQRISLTDLMSEDIDTEGKFLVLCLVRCQHHTQSQDQNLLPYRQGVKRFHSMVDKSSYLRMFTFADPETPTHCAVLFEVSKNQDGFTKESSLWRKSVTHRSEVSIGTWFAIFEPDGVIQKTKVGDCAKLESKFSLFPLKKPTLTTYFQRPTVPNVMESFFLTSTSIEVKGTNAVDSNCGGTFCDRQEGTASKCSCYSQRPASSNVVLISDIVWSYNEEKYTAHDFSSLKFSDLPFKKRPIRDGTITMEEINGKMILELRKVLAALVNYINENSGWTIIGWAMLPESKEDQAYNESIKYHISYLWPSDVDDLTSYYELYGEELLDK